MKSWNPFGKVDMEIGSFLEGSVFNKEYKYNEENKGNNSDDTMFKNKTNDDKHINNKTINDKTIDD